MCSSSLCQGDMTCSFVKRIEIEFCKVFSPLQAIMQMSFHCSFFLFFYNILLFPVIFVSIFGPHIFLLVAILYFLYFFGPAHFNVRPCFVARTEMFPAAYANTPLFSEKTFCFHCAVLPWMEIPKLELSLENVASSTF